MSSEQVPDVKAEVTRLFECCICCQDLQDTHFCPGCSQPFCRTCIDEWLANTENCPCCRRELSTSAVVKARTFDQIQQVVYRLMSGETGNRCSKHRKEPLQFFCFSCRECVCAYCMYSNQHEKHKGRIVLLDVAYSKFKDKLTASLKSMENRQEKLEELSIRLYMKRLMLQAGCTGVRSQVDQLQNDEKNAISLVKMMEALKISEKYLWDEKLEADLCIPETTTLIFHLQRYVSEIRRGQMYESSSLTKDGFTWMLRCFNGTIALQLQEGIPGEYALNVGSKLAVTKKFELRKFVAIANHDDLQIDSLNDTAKLKLRIQQARSYAEKCTHLEGYIERLETAKSNDQFMRFLIQVVIVLFVLVIGKTFVE